MTLARAARSRGAHWAVPAGLVVLLAGGMATNGLVTQAAPALPGRTAAQLLADLAQAKPVPMSGTISETANLGLPQLPTTGAGQSTSLTALLSGTSTMRFWVDGPTKVRIALTGRLAESDVVRNGAQLWTWSSQSNSVTHVQLPATSGSGGSARAWAAPGGSLDSLTPLSAAERVLASVDPTTSVTVGPPQRVAGRGAYTLVVSPRQAGSLVGQVRIALDAATSVPLSVTVYPVGSTAPALSTGFTSVSFSTPPASVFAFTPPPGATVKTMVLPGRGPAQHLGGTTPAPGGSSPGLPMTTGSVPTVVGSGWTSVLAVRGVSMTSLGSAAGGGSSAALLGALLASATSVAGPATGSSPAWSGRLVSTSLLSVLLLNDGRLLVGAVTPAVLEAAVVGVPRVATPASGTPRPWGVEPSTGVPVSSAF